MFNNFLPQAAGAFQRSAPESTLQRCLHWYMKQVHAPALLRRPVQLAVLLTFVTGGCGVWMKAILCIVGEPRHYVHAAPSA